MENSQQENYSVWKKNVPLLYTQLQTSSLLWPTLSLDWLPDTTTPASTAKQQKSQYDYDQHRILLSTFSDGLNPIESILLTRLNLFDLQAKDYKNLQNFDFIPSSNEFIYSLPLPHLQNTKELTNVNQNDEVDADQQHVTASTTSTMVDLIDGDIQMTTIESDTTSAPPSAEQPKAKINNSLGLMQRIPHVGDVNRIKHCPQNIDLIATTSDCGFVRIFDRTKKSNNLDINNDLDPGVETSDILLRTHNSEAWTLDWNLQKPFTLASASNDGSIAIWNLKDQFKSPPRQKFSTLDSKYRFATCYLDTPEYLIPAHNFGVNEIRWVPDHDSLLVSSGEDGICKVWDTRNKTNASILQFFAGADEKTPFNTVDINPFETFKLVTGNANGTLNFLDMRNPSDVISKTNHTGPITSSKYSPHLKDTLATSSADATVTIWKNREPAFVHHGHLLSVSDVVWCPSRPGVLASCSYDNSVHVWQPII